MYNLAGVVFHHQLFVQVHRNLFAQRSAHQLAFELGLVDLQVNRSFRSAGNGFVDLHVGLGAVAQGDHITDLDGTAGGKAALAIDLEMAVGNVLTSSKNGASETETVDEGVNTGLEDLEQVVARRTVAAVGFVERLFELGFGNIVGELQTLLFDKLLLVNGSGLLAVQAMLSGGEIAAIQNFLGLGSDSEPERAGDLGFRSVIHVYLVRKLFGLSLAIGRAWRKSKTRGQY